jgi:c-di-GMP-related signal transduction protein
VPKKGEAETRPREQGEVPMPSVHIGRQPIYDREQSVHGYELLFRNSDGGPNAPAGTDAAITSVIVNTLTEYGLDRLVGEKLAFVNVTRPFVVDEMPLPFGPDQAVLELLPHASVDDELVHGAKLLADQGYKIALDDFRWEPERLDLLPYTSYVKVDVTECSREYLEEAVARCREAGVLAVAQRVDDKAALALCTEIGFDLFQGHFSLRPETVVARTMSPSHLAGLQLLARLSDPEVSLKDIEEIVRTDLALNYRVLRAANASSSGVRRPIESIKDALVLLGAQRLRSWLLLMVMSDSGQGDEEALSTAMTRARTCELLAQQTQDIRPSSAFFVGVLSGLELVLGVPMAQVVENLPLADDVRDALLDGGGALGELLDAVLAYEESNDFGVLSTRFDVFDLSRAYLDAVGWSLQLCESALSA